MLRRDILKALPMGAFAFNEALAQSAATQTQASGNNRNRQSSGFTLVLGGGSARGFAHIGVIKALQENNLVPDMVVGTSAGALIGALYASGLSIPAIEALAIKTKELDLVDFSSSRMGTINGFALQNWVNKAVRGLTIEQFPIRFIALATNLRSWQPVYFQSGNPGLAVRASSSIPGVFVPVNINGNELVDGGLISPMPAKFAKSMRSRYVIGVDISSSANAAPSELTNMFEIVMQSFDIMTSSLTELESKYCDVVIRPDISQYKSTDFTARAPLIAAGYEAGKSLIPTIREGLQRAQRNAK